jgi:hypothetical protein
MMTYTELTAAIWDVRAVTLVDAFMQPVENATPIGLRRTISHHNLWIVYYTRPGVSDWESCVMRFDLCDGH